MGVRLRESHLPTVCACTRARRHSRTSDRGQIKLHVRKTEPCFLHPASVITTLGSESRGSNSEIASATTHNDQSPALCRQIWPATSRHVQKVHRSRDSLSIFTHYQLLYTNISPRQQQRPVRLQNTCRRRHPRSILLPPTCPAQCTPVKSREQKVLQYRRASKLWIQQHTAKKAAISQYAHLPC